MQCIEDIDTATPIQSGLLVYQDDAGALKAALLDGSVGVWHIMSFEALKHERFTSRYDLAVMVVGENTTDLPRLITKLRDTIAGQVLVLADARVDLLAFGFERLSKLPSANLWQFNILTYKQTPDWLNAKYWANPENWGKYRW